MRQVCLTFQNQKPRRIAHHLRHIPDIPDRPDMPSVPNTPKPPKPFFFSEYYESEEIPEHSGNCGSGP